VPDLKEELHRKLQASRAVLLSKLEQPDESSEYIDGKGGPDQDDIDDAAWREYTTRVQAAASTFVTDPEARPPH
jgi:hypothetical protein